MVSATLRIAVTGVASLTSGVIVLAFFQDRLVTVIAVALISVGFSILNQVRTYFLMAGPPRPLLAWVLVFRLLYCSGQAPSAWAYSALSRYISVRAPFSGCRRCFCPWYLSQAQSATPGSCKAPKDRPSYQKAPQCSACKRVAVQGVAPAIRPAMPAIRPAMTGVIVQRTIIPAFPAVRHCGPHGPCIV